MLRVRHLKKGDQVVALSGAHLGKSGKVSEVNHKRAEIKVEGIGVTKRHQKPNQANRSGGIVEGLRWWPACKFKVVGK
jgi:large subunit ribosomal protein L24